MNSGIQRVVRNIVRSAIAGGLERRIIPVIAKDDRFIAIETDIPYPGMSVTPKSSIEASVALHRRVVTLTKRAIKSGFQFVRATMARLIPIPSFRTFLYAPRYEWGLSRIVLLPIMAFKSRTPDERISEGVDIGQGDVLILLDSSWHLNLWRAVDKCKLKGASVAVVVYDLIPRLHPQFCHDGLIPIFNKWFEKVMPRADVVVAISQAVARDIEKDLVKLFPVSVVPPVVTYFWLGSELDGEKMDIGSVSVTSDRPYRNGCPTYIYVSTIERRKNHCYALEAFERLWNLGISANLVVVGRVGWKCDKFIQRVKTHPRIGKNLFMFNDMEDNELAYLYDHAQALIFTSFIEGFGLPIVEGLQRGLSVFASDIPVFREIGRTGVEFVDLLDSNSLTEALVRHIKQGAPRLHEPVQWLSWHESAMLLFDRIDACIRDGIGSKLTVDLSLRACSVSFQQ